MNRTHVLLVLAALVVAGAAALWWRTGGKPATPRVAPVAESEQPRNRHGAASRSTADGAHPATAAQQAEPETATAASQESDAPGARHEPPRTPPAPARVPWPVARGSHAASASQTPAQEPEVPVKLAFRALWYLGVDPEAERTWSRAINDPNLPEGVRSDLIVDMVDEGYTDNNRPGKADLPVILARLEILERYRPYAMDQVNARAFDEAYRTLLELYIRLGGEPRGQR